MIDKHLVEKKLRKIEEYLRELNNAKVKGMKQFKNDVVIKRFVERNIELAIEQMVDVCKHFVSAMDLREPENYAECFDILAENKIVKKETVNTFKAMVRFRNLLIHAYDGVDDSITYAIYKKRLKDFRMFIEIVRGYLKNKEKKNN